MATARARHRFTVDEYEEMIRSGILREDDRVELIHGEILEKTPVGDLHAACVNRSNRLLSRMVGDAAIVSIQNPIRLADSEPEPDIALLRPRDDFYASGRPTARDVLLVIEVSDTTLDFDRDVKGPLYADAGIGEYWIVNLNDHVIEVYRGPTGERSYSQSQRATAADILTPVSLPELRISVAEILPEKGKDS